LLHVKFPGAPVEIAPAGASCRASGADAAPTQPRTMRFMIIVRAHPDSEAETLPAPDAQLLSDMAAYHQQLAEAGVLLGAAGLRPSREAAVERVRRFPSPFGAQHCEIEVRQLWELDDFPPSEAVDTFRAMTPAGTH
jgi:hypothetical protein